VTTSIPDWFRLRNRADVVPHGQSVVPQIRAALSSSFGINGSQFIREPTFQPKVEGSKATYLLAREGVGERGRNRTFNLLIFDQQPQTSGFNGFPNDFVVTSRQV
jgi:hypothetical protein